MINLNTYRQELLSSISLIYFKLSLIEEYYSIFKQLSKIQFSTDILKKQYTEILKNKYLFSIQQIISTKFNINFDSIIEKAINEVLDSLNSLDNDKISLNNFPNLLNVYNTEFVNDINFEFLNIEKYKTKSFYIEKYCRLIDNNQPIITIPLLQNRPIEYKDIVNVLKLREFLLIRDQNTDLDFFSIIKDILFGVRLIYLPEINNINKQTLYNNIISDDKVKLKKINAIKGKFSSNDQINYFFPLKISEYETSIVNIPGIGPNKNNIIEFINNQLIEDTLFLDNSIFNLSNTDNFKKLFRYHIPFQTFEVLYPTEQILINDLIKKVYSENLPKNNIDILINLIDNIVNAEDPTKI